MLSADIVMIEAISLFNRVLNHLLGAGRQLLVSDHRALAGANDKFNCAARLRQLHPQLIEHAGRDPFALADQPQQNMLGADIWMVKRARLFGG